jgi:hypothetical protein
LIDSWREVCPLRTRCSECGLEIDVANVISQINRGPVWSFEHRGGRFWRRWAGTSLRTFRPGRFCRELRIDHRVNARRLILFALIWLLLVHLFYAAIAVYGLGTFGKFNGWLATWGIDLTMPEAKKALTLAVLAPYAGEIRYSPRPNSTTSMHIFPVFLITYIPAALMPLWMLALGTTLKAARVKAVHLFRGMVYTVPAAALLALVPGLILLTESLLTPKGFWPRGADVAAGIVLAGCLLGFPIFHTRWWRQFMAHHLCIRHATATAVLLQVCSALVVVLAGVGISFLSGPF